MSPFYNETPKCALKTSKQVLYYIRKTNSGICLDGLGSMYVEIHKQARGSTTACRALCIFGLPQGKQSDVHDTTNWLAHAACKTVPSKSVMMYRIVNKLVAIPEEVHLTRRESSTRGHSTRFHQPYTRVLAYKHSFFPSTIRIWNSLPENLTQKPSIDGFGRV